MSDVREIKVGFIGIGNMGWPMAMNIHEVGYTLTVFDLDSARSESFAVETGARSAVSLAELGEMDFVIIMLPNGHVVREVLIETEDGAFIQHAQKGCIVIDMSSAEPTGTRSLAEELAIKEVACIDAPVSGGVARAKLGTLTIMIGAEDKQALEKAKPLLQIMGDQLFETGGIGAGHATKALNNLIAATSFVATSEAMLAAKRFGLDLDTFVDVVNVSSGQNFMTDKVMKDHVIGEKYATGFAMGLLVKDVGIANELCDAVNMHAPLSNLVLKRWQEALDVKGFSADNSEAIQIWDRNTQD
ncbi:MAG: NAD(P)-dependent oxidoreductase [Gammaproteobacteria bacterium]|nr:NAD(P)-dependent oxidoreductase [Gammaproteobacteria bacterium]